MTDLLQGYCTGLPNSVKLCRENHIVGPLTRASRGVVARCIVDPNPIENRRARVLTHEAMQSGVPSYDLRVIGRVVLTG